MILDIWGNDHDVTNFCVTDKALVVNSSGRNTSMGGTFTLNDELRINRPAGRLDYQLLYVQYGESHHVLDGKWQNVKAGGVVIYHPGEPQFYSYLPNTPVICHWVHFSGYNVENLLKQCDLYGLSVFDIGERRDVEKIMRQILNERQLRLPYFEENCAALLAQVLILIGRYRREILKKEPSKTEKMIRDAIAHMHCHYQEVQNLQEYADRCGMTPDRFCHVFKEHTGVSPYAYLISLRMRLARELLSGSDMPVKDVAMACGYENALYFSRLFTKRYHLSPTQLRQAAKNQREP